MSARTRDMEFKPAQCGWSEDHKVFAVIERPLRLDRVNSTREDIKPERNLFACSESRVKAEGGQPRGDLNRPRVVLRIGSDQVNPPGIGLGSINRCRGMA